MSISTDLSSAPFFDDYDETKDYYRILYRPGLPVQTRELNQMQTILQKQIERFGDNIYQPGTIIDGCNFTLHDKLPYVKIKDTDASGQGLQLDDFKGLYVRNSSNLIALIADTAHGYVASAPNLNTLFVKYLNSGNDGETSAFSSEEVLTIYNPEDPVYSVQITNPSSGFSNNDILVVSPAIEVQNSVGTNVFPNGFFVGDFISNGLGANVEIVSVTPDNERNTLVIGYKPTAAALFSQDSSLWTINVGNAIIDTVTGEAADVVGQIGSGLAGRVTTDSIGRVTSVTLVSTGSGYHYPPTLTVRSTTASQGQLGVLGLVAQNYLSRVTVAEDSYEPIGFGYGVSVSSGVIYQKGEFLRTQEQFALVEKYGLPDQKVVGFDVEEEIIDFNADQSLLDNALGTPNATAPGASRLKLTPRLSVQSKEAAEANTEFLSLIEFAEGRAYKQATRTQYNVIEEEMAKRTYEESGNYVLDEFLLKTRSPTNFEDEASMFSIVVDQGIAYINGHRVETKDLYTQNIDKGTETSTTTGAVSTEYGNYIRVRNLGGTFPINDSSKTVQLRSAPSNFVSGAMAPAGSEMGTARIRSIVPENQSTGIYRVYLFDIKLQPGKNFKNVRSLYRATNPQCTADIILDSANNASIFDNNLSGMIFDPGLKALKEITDVTYRYRSADTSLVANSSGYITKSLIGNETFPYVGSFSTAEKQDLMVIPQVDITSTANLSGSVSVSSGSAVVTGTATAFLTEVAPGDFLKFANSTANVIGKVSSVANNTSLTLVANAASAITGNAIPFFPANVPVNMLHPARTAVTIDEQTLQINLGSAMNSANVSVVTDIQVNNAAPVSKTVNRGIQVRITCANNVGGTLGPWCLGKTDIFRLNRVYRGPNTTFNVGEVGVVDVTDHFYADHNQNEDFYNLGYLMKKPTSNLTLASGDCLLVDFDHFAAAQGLTWVDSYNIDDSLPLANSATSINTVEIPEMFGLKNTYYDLRDCLDFRPRATDTANTGAIDPAETVAFTADTYKYPAPYSEIRATFTYYNGRKDMVVIDERGNIRAVKGSKDGNLPEKPLNVILVDELNIPPYPSLPEVLSATQAEFADTKVANEKYSNRRLTDYAVSSILSKALKISSQPKNYTMEEIGRLERRIETLEYYVTFTLQETQLKNKSIPSSVDNYTERFKFGFFVDSFEDDSYSDYNNPQFNADFMNGRLVPKTERFNLQLTNVDDEGVTGDSVLGSFDEYVLINQPYATQPIAPITATATTTTTQVVSQRIVSQVIRNKNKLTSISGSVQEISEFVMSSTNGPVEMYFNFRDNNNAVEIFQGTSPGFSIVGKAPIRNAWSAVPLTTLDKNTKAAGLGNKHEALSLQGYLGNPPKPTCEDSGKILFTHNAANGRYYKIVITKYRKSGQADNWKGVFYYRLYYPSDVTTTQTVVVTPKIFTYQGTLVTNPKALEIQTLFNPTPSSPYQGVAGQQKVTITATGLKPNTNHLFFVNDSNASSLCKPSGGLMGSILKSNASGALTFDYYHDANILTNSAYTAKNAAAASTASGKVLTIRSADLSSGAWTTITPPPAAKPPVNTPTNNNPKIIGRWSM